MVLFSKGLQFFVPSILVNVSPSAGLGAATFHSGSSNNVFVVYSPRNMFFVVYPNTVKCLVPSINFPDKLNV